MRAATLLQSRPARRQRRLRTESHRHGFRRRSDVPLVRALDASSIVTGRFCELCLGADVTALRARLRYRLVPDDEVALGIVRTAVERLPALLGPTDGDVAAILGAFHTGRHRSRPTALRESAATKKLAGTTVTNDHGRSTLMADLVGGLSGLAIAAQRPRILALLGVVLAGEERPEKSAAWN